MSNHDNHGLTPTRPRVSVLEGSILEQLRDLRERVAALEAERAKPSDREEFAAAYAKVYAARGGTVERGREVFDLLHGPEDRLTDALHAVVMRAGGA